MHTGLGDQPDALLAQAGGPVAQQYSKAYFALRDQIACHRRPGKHGNGVSMSAGLIEGRRFQNGR
ncbi:MAG: hypothetical protein LOD94_06565 [Gammaproteobacteria bacterium]